MEINKQVCSLDLAKKMKELGFEQDSVFTWVQDTENGEYKLESFNSDFHGAVHNYWACGRDDKEHPMFSAYTVAELGEFLKKVNFEKSKIKTLPEEFCPRTEDESLKVTFDQNFWAKMLIYLKEQELI